MTSDQQDKGTPEEWIYTGIRVSADHKRCSSWMDPYGNELLYLAKGRVTWSIGSIYAVRVTRTPQEDGQRDRVTLHGSFTYQRRDTISPQDKLKFEALNIAAERELSRRKQERDSKQRKQIDEALEPLLDVARQMHTYQDKDALVAYIIRRVQGAWL